MYTAELGKAEIVCPYAVVSDNAEIGDACIINMYLSAAHNFVQYCDVKYKAGDEINRYFGKEGGNGILRVYEMDMIKRG